MLNPELIIKRLSLIKYLYKQGIEQSYQTETIAAFSILNLHDSIEMFLKLVAENKNIKSDKFSFIEYWSKIEGLTLKESMSNLNARRVNIKHKGLLPSKSDIEISRVNTTDFFEQNTKKFFDIDFYKISLLDLISYVSVREHLEKSQDFLDKGNFEDSIKNSSIAFEELISTYEKSKSSWFHNSPFFFGKSLSFLSSYNIGLGRDLGGTQGRKIDEFIDNVKDSLEDIQKAVKILSLGIDYKKYSKFKLLTPNIRKTIDGEYVLEIWRKKKWTKNNCQFCIDFVFDCSQKLQEFDFDINELIDNEIPIADILEEKKENTQL